MFCSLVIKTLTMIENNDNNKDNVNLLCRGLTSP